MTASAEEVLTFWFTELKPAQHFRKDEKVDLEISRRFTEVHQLASAGRLAGWRSCTQGRLAEIIVLDQFSRNLFRDDPRAWAQDDQALTLAKEMVELGLDQDLETDRRTYVYMPFMHSESRQIQDESVRLFERLGRESNLKYAILHRDLIKQFGRFPYRNPLLGRESTPAEVEYTRTHGSF